MNVFESQPVETAIGLVLLFFVIALAASSLVELISQVFKIRANDLERTLGQMLAGKPVTAPTKIENLSADERTLLGIPTNTVGGELTTAQQDVLRALPDYSDAEAIANAIGAFKGTSVYEAASAGARRGLKRGKPSYLAARSFAEGVAEMLGDVRTVGTVTSAADFALVPSGLRRRISSLAAEAETIGADANAKAIAIKAGLEHWFDETMARAEGAYRRWAKWWIFGIALVIAVAANASAFHVADRLWHDPATRSAVVSAAGRTAAADTDPATDVTSVAEAADELTELKLPVGWDQNSKNSWNEGQDFFGSWGPWTMIAGWLVTALLVSLGAPFWFGLLTKLVSLRSTGAKPAAAGDDPGSATSLRADAASAPSAATVPNTAVVDLDALAAFAASPPASIPDPAVPDPDKTRNTIATAFGIPTTT